MTKPTTATFNAEETYRDTTIDPGAHPALLGMPRNLLSIAHETGELEFPTKLVGAVELNLGVTALLEEQRTQQTNLGVDGYCAELAEAVISGQRTMPPVEQLISEALEAASHNQRLEAAGTALMRLDLTAKEAVKRVFQEAQDELIGSLQAKFDPLMVEIRAAAKELEGLDLSDAHQVASATAKQKAAILALPDLTRRYNRLRMIQRHVYEASPAEPVGYNPHRPHWTWRKVYERGVHEFKDVTLGDSGPSADLPPTTRLMRVAARDTWLPTRTEMATALTALEPSQEPRKSTNVRAVAEEAAKSGRSVYLNLGSHGGVDPDA